MIATLNKRDAFDQDCRYFWQCPSCLRETAEDYHCGENCFQMIELPSGETIDAEEDSAKYELAFLRWASGAELSQNNKSEAN